MNKTHIRTMTFVALSAAIICALSPFSFAIPVSPVPISLSILAIYIAVYACGFKWGSAAVLLYILIGLAGVPVFAGFSAGPAKLMGPTGGYIVGYVFVSLIAGLFIEKFESKLYMHAVGMVLGTAVCYMLGTFWLSVTASLTFKAALFAGVIPYIPADIVKIIIALLTGPAIRKAIKKL
ncbi:MAG: biotin transporter BioY [Lachnospiraceae bacterium]|nr:biotin transporter BioY [Lachnospiraceae bacterium]